jgi:protoporphyrinogen oxidase
LTEPKHEVVVIGAGPAGLTAAYELSKHGIAGTILEADECVGGISRTVERDGYRFDVGGHRFFSKSEEVERLWDEMLSEPMLVRPRLSRIYYRGKFYDYPIKAGNALKNMGVVAAISCLLSYARSKLAPIRDPRNLEQWVTNQFGHKLYTMFFKTYTEKVWGIPCTEIGADWAAQRIKGLSLGTAVKSALFGHKAGGGVKTLIEEFRYPRLGPGQLWQDCAKAVEQKGWRIELGARVVGVEMSGDAIQSVVVRDSGAERVLPCSHVFSSMPLRDMLLGMSPSAPGEVRDAADKLTYRDFLTVALVLDAESVFPDNWIYIHSPEVKLGRIQNFKNWSPDLVPDPSKTCLGLEYFCYEGDDLWNTPDADLIELGYEEISRLGVAGGALLKGYVVRVPKAYPVYDSGYAERLALVREWLSGIGNLYCMGRNGQHRYNNMDHSMMTALIAARNVALGQSRDPWAVNEDAEYIEHASADGATDSAQES